MQQTQWQDRFNIGVEVIDQAHRRLFSIVEKIMDLYVQKHEDKFACVEGIKYFKAYAAKHFAEEEAYMRAVRYPGYLAHKRLHDKMKRETLPALEKALYTSNFSTEVVQRFIGVCTGWLTGHIIIEDRAIIGKSTNDFTPLQMNDELSVIQAVILYPLQEMLGINIQFIGEFSAQDTIMDAQYYELTYSTQQGQKLRFILAIGEQMLLRAASLLFGIEFYARNEIVRFAMQEIVQSLMQRAAACFGDGPDVYHLEEDHFLEDEEYDRIFREQTPQYSLLFRAKHDCFALSIYQMPSPDSPQPLNQPEP